MAKTINKPAREVEERTHFFGCHIPKGQQPSIYVLREEIDEGKATNKGEKMRLTWAEIKAHPAFVTFRQTIPLTNDDDLMTAIATLFDDIIEN